MIYIPKMISKVKVMQMRKDLQMLVTNINVKVIRAFKALEKEN